MKKVLSMMLTLTMCLFLCACGGQAKDTDAADSAQANGSSEQDVTLDNNRIEFSDAIILGEDENFRVELVNIYEETFDWDNYKLEDLSGKRSEKVVTFKLINKSEDKYRAHLSSLYVGPDGANHFAIDENLHEILPGKNITCRYVVFTGEHEPLDNLEDLLLLDGEFYITPVRDNVGIGGESYDFRFSAPDAMENNEQISDSNNDIQMVEQTSSGEKIEEIIKQIDAIVIEDIIVSDAVKEQLSGIYAKYNELSDEEKGKVTNFETLEKAKDTYNEMWVHSLVKIEKIWFTQDRYSNEIILNIDWVNKSSETIKYIKFDVAVTNSVGDYIMWNGYDYNRYTLTGPFATNHRATERWSTMRYRAADEVGWPVVNQIYIEYMDGSAATITENIVHFALPQ